MKNSTKSSRVSQKQSAALPQANTLLREQSEHHPTRVGAKPESSHHVAALPKNHLAWYVEYKPDKLEREVPTMHQIKWKCPPKFALNSEWKVAAGEESQEARAYEEVIDFNAIPSNPHACPHVENDWYDDSLTPIIPIEEVEANMASDTSVRVNTRIDPQPPVSCPSATKSQEQHVHRKSLPNRLHGLESRNMAIAAAAAAAAATVTAVMQSTDQIDTELVIKFLTNPEMVKKLMSGDVLTSKPEDEVPPPPAPKPNSCFPLPSLKPASVVDKLANGCSEPVSRAVLPNSKPSPQAVNQYTFLPCCRVETEIKKVSGSGLHTPEAENPSPFLPCSKAGAIIKKGASKLGGKHAVSGLLKQKAGNPSSSLPRSKAEIKKCANKLGGMRAGSGPCTLKPDNQSPFLPCSKAEAEMKKGTSKLGDMRAESGPHTQKGDNQSPSFPCSKSDAEIKRSASKIGVMLAGSGLHTVNEKNRSTSLPCSKPATEIKKSEYKLGGMPAGSEPHTQKEENQSPSLPCLEAVPGILKSASKLGGMLAGSRARTSKAEKRPCPSPRLNSDRPTKMLTIKPGSPARPCTDQSVREQKASTLVSSTFTANEELICRQTENYGGPDFSGVKLANSLNPYPSKPDLEAVKKLIHTYGACDVSARVMPMSPPVASPSFPPREEEMDRVVERYLLPDQGWSKAFIGPSSSLLAPTASPPVTNLHAFSNPPEFHYSGAGNFHPNFHPMTIPGRPVDLQYHHSLIKQHELSGNYSQGIEVGHNINRNQMNPIYQRPSMHFSNSTGYPNGYNYMYQHDGLSRQWSRAGVHGEAPPHEQPPRWPRG